MTSCPPPPTSRDLQFNVKNLFPRETSLPHKTPSDTAVGSSRAHEAQRATNSNRLSSWKSWRGWLKGARFSDSEKHREIFCPTGPRSRLLEPEIAPGTILPCYLLPLTCRLIYIYNASPSRKHTQRLRDEEGWFIFVETTLRKDHNSDAFFFHRDSTYVREHSE